MFFIGKHRQQSDTLRRSCTSEPMIHHKAGALASTNCHMYGTKFYRTLQDPNSSNTLGTLTPPLPLLVLYSPTAHYSEGTTIFLVSIPCRGAILHLPSLPLHPYSLVLVVPSLVSTHYLFI